MKIRIHFNSAAVEVREWMSYFIAHCIMDVITCTCWDLSQTILVTGASECFTLLAGTFWNCMMTLLRTCIWRMVTVIAIMVSGIVFLTRTTCPISRSEMNVEYPNQNSSKDDNGGKNGNALEVLCTKETLTHRTSQSVLLRNIHL